MTTLLSETKSLIKDKQMKMDKKNNFKTSNRNRKKITSLYDFWYSDIFSNFYCNWANYNYTKFKYRLIQNDMQVFSTQDF